MGAFTGIGYSPCFLAIPALFVLAHVACTAPAPAVVGVADDCCSGRTIYEDPDLTQTPEFPGGKAAMYVWLGNRLSRPADAIDVKEGPLVQFLVDCNGTLRDITVKVPAHTGMDSLAVEAVRAMPTWIPGRIRDRVVCTLHVIPVHFD